jgi:D-proline reductase (dithiol) PrdB
MIKYIERTRAFYAAQGYPAYGWASNDTTPFASMKKPLSKCRLALITTAAPYREDLPDQGPGAPYNGGAKFYDVYTAPTAPCPDLRISHVGYDRKHCKADDSNTWLPVAALRQACNEGIIASLASELISIPTNRSQRVTLTQDAPITLAHTRALQADVVLLVPNCPVCHQSVSLIARYLEEHEIPTVVMGCARDIVENVGVARFWWSDFPLGHSAGKAHNSDSQATTLAGALQLFTTAQSAETTVQSPQVWSNDDNWKQDFMNIANLSAAQIGKLKNEHEKTRTMKRKA